MKPQKFDLKQLEPVLQRPLSGTKWHLPYAARPRYLQLETVTKCNARCPFCPQNEIVRDPARMPDEVWKKIIDDTRGWGMTYRPFLTNEPFVDNRQVEIVRYIKENDPTAKVEFNTNGELVTEKLAIDLLEAGVDIMRFSIDGFSPETYEPSRVGLSYDKVVARVLHFLDMWDQGGYRDQIFTELRMIEVPENIHEVSAYRDFWAPRCSEVLITKMYQWPWTGQKPEDAVLKPCLKILDEMFFYTNGNATICCWDVHERAVIGNVVEQSVEDIWLGHLASQLRSTLDDGRRDLITLCSRCNAYEDYDFDRFKTTDK